MDDHAKTLRDAGLRATQQRRAIVAILSEPDAHPSADDIVAAVRRLDDATSVATVYRTLAALEAAGLARKIAIDDAPARYELTPQSDHDHLIDVDTGELVEIPNDEVRRLRARIAGEMGYDLVSQHTVLRGRRRD